ncbi:MAG TPA: hypothetical protein DDW76_26055 [Cyanobacteria bacterium UBA11369]|nr:hypothetical protein [Cyanobacteria bacterium UBA11371]HBE32743.1 hypothetical protein [Cyanobacteria bacterium UBA11368]HBE52139.1 hypothetical protein [Cyanobacteria bacterium UBA11369]
MQSAIRVTEPGTFLRNQKHPKAALSWASAACDRRHHDDDTRARYAKGTLGVKRSRSHKNIASTLKIYFYSPIRHKNYAKIDSLIIAIFRILQYKNCLRK